MSVYPDIFSTVAEGNDFQAALDSAVRIVSYRYGRYVDREDIYQEGWLWAYERSKTKFREIGDRSRTANRERMFRNALCNYLTEWARREVAHKTGVTPNRDDEFYYTVAMLRELMPDVYDPSQRRSGGQLGRELVTGGPDPAEGGEYMATIADIASALGRLSKDDQRVLFQKFCVGDSDEALGLSLGVPAGTAKVRVHRALGRLRKELGGPRTADDTREYVGSRRVLSNGAAQAITRNQMGE